MSKNEKNDEFYINAWHVGLHHCKRIELVCPQCAGCAVPYFVASHVFDWGLDEIQSLTKKLPFPTKVEKLAGKHGYKVMSFPSEPKHPSLFSNNHSGEEPHTIPFVLLCNDCHHRSKIGNSIEPKDLYWSVQTRHGVLWAYNRDWLTKVRNIILGDSRPRGPYTNRLPAEMLKASNRDEMIRLIDKVLLDGSRS